MVTLFIIAFAIIGYINFKGSYLQYSELGENYLNTFLKKEKIQYMVVSINFVCMFIMMYLAGRKIKKGLKVFFEQEKKDFPKLPNKSIALVFSAIESIFIGQIFTPNLILCISNTSFNKADPIFNLDISFFMFIEPILKMGIKYFIFIF